MAIWLEKRRYKMGGEVQFAYNDGEMVCVKGMFGKIRYGKILKHNSAISGADGYYANYTVELDDGTIKDFKEEKLGRERM